MTDLRKLWENVEKMSGGHDIPVGPTGECLSANKVALFMNYGEEDPKIIEHLKNCEVCREGITRFKQSNTF